MSEETKDEVVYVVQKQYRHEPSEGVVYLSWEDIATVKVPPKTKRDTVIKAALKQAGIKPAGDPLRLRALDARSAEVTEARPDAPEPQWELS